MKIVIAPDSFKGSLSAAVAARAVEKGIKKKYGSAVQTVCLPIADGGEGTLEALVPSENRIRIWAQNPLGDLMEVEYGARGDTAVIEMAAAAGLTLIPEQRRHAGKTTTFGVGQMILDALSRGYRKILLTVGGSATNDGGAGMFAALGAKFLDENGHSFVPTGFTLKQVVSLDLSDLPASFYGTQFAIATDVTNPLTGPTGAACVYGPQKGGTVTELLEIDLGMRHYADVLEKTGDRAVRDLPGCGAGGGIAAPLLAFGKAEMQKGIELVLQTADFDRVIADADVVITGEGKLDAQSFSGKTISGVVSHAARVHKPVVCVVGCYDEGALSALPDNVKGVLSARHLALSDDDSMQNAADYLEELAGTELYDILKKQ